jgi:hypothetical protein
MERYLREYVKEIAESIGIKLTQAQMKTIVNNLERNDVLWEVFDEHVKQEIEEVI